MRANQALYVLLILVVLLDKSWALFPLPFPFVGFPQWNPHMGPSGHPMFHGPRPMFHGNQEAFDVLHTHEHRSDHGPDGERMLMENKRMIGREMKYRPGDQYTKDTGNGRWKMFGHEVQKAHKDHSKLYVIPERPFRLHVGDGDHYGIPTSHHTDYESYKQGDWLKTGGWHDGDAGDHYRAAGHGAFPYERNYRRGKPTMAYREPQIRYHNAYDSGEWRPFYEKQKYKNHIHRNRSPTIGKRRGKGQSYQSYIKYTPDQVISGKSRDRKSYKNIYFSSEKDIYNGDWENIGSGWTDVGYIPVGRGENYKTVYTPRSHHTGRVYHYHSAHPVVDESSLIDNGWVEVENWDPYVDQYRFVNRRNHDGFIYL